ncbi:MAG: hypothetical protein HY245_15685 [Rhizobiales bacterium]|nr:hypothetical protein [Hyphomicrobiales bacterium]
MARLQLEEAEDQRAGEPQHGGGKRQAHAGQGLLQSVLQAFEDRRRLARAHVEGADRGADRTHRFQETPESAEEAKEDQEAHQIARLVARFIEARSQRIEERAHGQRRKDRRLPTAQQIGHGPQEPRLAQRVGGGFRFAEPVHPFDLGKQPPHHAVGMQYAEQQGRDDHRIEARIGQKGAFEAGQQHRHQDGDGEREHHHVHEIDPRRVQCGGGGRLGHGHITPFAGLAQ